MCKSTVLSWFLRGNSAVETAKKIADKAKKDKTSEDSARLDEKCTVYISMFAKCAHRCSSSSETEVHEELSRHIRL